MASTELDPSTGVPLYRQIISILRDEISSGQVDASEPMTEEKLLVRFGVSRAPIRQALTELANTGYVYRKQGRGTFPVTGARVDRPAALRSGDLFRYLEEQGLHPGSEVTNIDRVRPPESIASKLGLESDERVLRFARSMHADGGPISENQVYVRSPEGFHPTEEELRDGGSAFALLERHYGVVVDRAEHEAWATAATEEQALVLGVAPHSPLLVIDTLFYARGGAPTGWRSAVHRADEFKFHFVTGG